MKKQLYIKKENGRYEPYKEPEPNDKNIYRKVGNKYVPFGLYDYNEERLQDGLWLVRHNGKRMMNADHYASRWGFTKVADIPVTDMTRIAEAEDVYEAVDKYLFDTFGFTVGERPHQDVAEEITKMLMSIGKTKEEQKYGAWDV